jgi:predicted transcriptional regulator
MIMTVAELRRFIQTDEDDQVLEAKLQALELSIRAYTNNNFQIRAYRAVAVAMAEHDLLCNGTVSFRAGDTLQITDSDLMPDMLATVESVDGNTITVTEGIMDESGVVITKVKYPQDVKMGVVNLMKWELDNREKVGVASESISRHSVTYFNMDGDNSVMGYPKSLMGFLRPYMKARFGRGISV